jgi:thiosulfate reductase cytochrome b subunit
VRVVRQLRLLILGETWILPLGVASLLVAGALVRHLAPHAWHDAGGFLLVAGVIAVLAAALADGRLSRRP